MKVKEIIDVRPIGENATTSEVLEFSKDVAVDALFQAATNIIGILNDSAKGCVKLYERDFEGAKEVAQKNVNHFLDGSVAVVDSGIAVTKSAYHAIIEDEPFITFENKAHLTRLCQFGIYAGIADFLIDTDKT